MRGGSDPVAPGRDRVGFCPQGFHMYADLTVAENVEFFGSVYGLDRTTLAPTRADELLEFAGLTEHHDRLAGHAVGGHAPEADPGLLGAAPPADPAARRADDRRRPAVAAGVLGAGRGAARRRASTILLASAYFDEVERCQRVVFLHDGRVLATGHHRRPGTGATPRSSRRSGPGWPTPPSDGVGGGRPRAGGRDRGGVGAAT